MAVSLEWVGEGTHEVNLHVHIHEATGDATLSGTSVVRPGGSRNRRHYARPPQRSSSSRWRAAVKATPARNGISENAACTSTAGRNGTSRARVGRPTSASLHLARTEFHWVSRSVRRNGRRRAVVAGFSLDTSMRSEGRSGPEGRGVIIRTALSTHAEVVQMTGVAARVSARRRNRPKCRNGLLAVKGKMDILHGSSTMLVVACIRINRAAGNRSANICEGRGRPN